MTPVPRPPAATSEGRRDRTRASKPDSAPASTPGAGSAPGSATTKTAATTATTAPARDAGTDSDASPGSAAEPVAAQNPDATPDTEPRALPGAGRALAILNPTSGRHRPEASKAALEEAFERAGWRVEVRPTTGEGDATRFAEEAALSGDYDLVAVAGGDGTVMEAVQGLVDADVVEPGEEARADGGSRVRAALPLLIAPLGTGNGLASTLHVPAGIERAVAASLGGRRQRIDLGRMVDRDRVFSIFAGAGLDADVIRDADRTAKDRLGPLAYLAQALRHMFGRPLRPIRLTVDGEERELEAHTVMAFNASGRIFSNLTIGPAADASDGKFEVVVIDSEPGLGTLARLLELMGAGKDTLELDGVFTASRLIVEADPPLPVHADGEPLGETPFELEALPGALEVWVPR